MSDEIIPVLLAEDDEPIRHLIERILLRHGIAFESVEDGSQALDRLERQRYQLVLLDLMMPRRSGWDVIDTIGKKIPPSIRPLVVVLTADSTLHQLDPAVVLAVIAKPFDITVLIETVRSCLGCEPGHLQQRAIAVTQHQPDAETDPMQTN
jgi:CheY-like chemotaxis protein